MKALIGSHIGQIRKVNEDSGGILYFEDGCIMVLCDGMGGHSAGDIASKMAVTEALNRLSKLDYKNVFRVTHDIKEVIQEVNDTINAISQKNIEMMGMGTTLVGVVITATNIFVFNVGDSRAYFLDDKEQFIQVSVDHKMVNKWVSEGLITKEDAEVDPSRNILYQALGTESKLDVAVKIVKNKGNIRQILLASDGLTDLVSDENIKFALQNKKNIDAKIVNLINQANNNGGKDNITIGIIELEGDKEC